LELAVVTDAVAMSMGAAELVAAIRALWYREEMR
jgi:hypothetical protein